MLAPLMALIALATMLVWASPSSAAPPGPGGDPGPECTADITGTLTATPSSIDRETTSALVTTLVWSVVVPSDCHVSPIVTLESRTVGLSGRMTVGVMRTTTFFLRLAREHRDLAHATVTVQGDPGFITVSSGRQVTADDIAKFNAQWMQPYQHDIAVAFATGNLVRRDRSAATAIGERMAAMVRMNDLTHDPRYLDHLHELIAIALQNRDDKHPGFTDPITHENFPPRPLDEIRNRSGLPAWGGKEGNGGLHAVDEFVSSLYAYPIAAFARIVAGNPSLQGAYGNDAMDGANAVLETVNLFLPQIRGRRAGAFIEAALTMHDGYRNKPSASDCQGEYDRNMRDDPQNRNRWDQICKNCNNLRKQAGHPLAHNENFAFAMVLIELSRVLDSDFYQHSPRRSSNAGSIRGLLPVIVSRQQRYFVNRLNPSDLRGPVQCQRNVCWHYMDDVAPGVGTHAEDPDHGSLDMFYLGLLRRDFGRLNAAAASSHEPIAQPLVNFARTFVENIAAGANINHDVAGNAWEPFDKWNNICYGWLDLTWEDARVYQKCHDVSLRIVDGRQPYLNIGNHASLLANKQFLPPAPPPSSGDRPRR